MNEGLEPTRRDNQASPLEKTARTLMAGAALLGTVAATHVPEAHAEAPSTIETQESALGQQADALMKQISEMKAEHEGPLGTFELNTKIQPLIVIFAASFRNIDAAPGISPVKQQAAKNFLLPRLLDMQSKNSELKANAGLAVFEQALRQPSAQLTDEQRASLAKFYGKN
ncbi:MAG TPA: hypothetical protein VN495_00900 [Candidatus Paceibacterota bacterium]|nr:hypothetical protein [Candidatus Paceibacterota bacterium]